MMDWRAFALSLDLAFWTMLILFPAGIFLGRALAWQKFRGKPLVEAALALPLVLPPTVLGFYLLMAFGAGSPLGQWYQGLLAGRLCSASRACCLPR